MSHCAPAQPDAHTHVLADTDSDDRLRPRNYPNNEIYWDDPTVEQLNSGGAGSTNYKLFS